MLASPGSSNRSSANTVPRSGSSTHSCQPVWRTRRSTPSACVPGPSRPPEKGWRTRRGGYGAATTGEGAAGRFSGAAHAPCAGPPGGVAAHAPAARSTAPTRNTALPFTATPRILANHDRAGSNGRHGCSPGQPASGPMPASRESPNDVASSGGGSSGTHAAASVKAARAVAGSLTRSGNAMRVPELVGGPVEGGDVYVAGRVDGEHGGRALHELGLDGLVIPEATVAVGIVDA